MSETPKVNKRRNKTTGKITTYTQHVYQVSQPKLSDTVDKLLDELG